MNTQTENQTPAARPLLTDPVVTRWLDVGNCFLRHDRMRDKPLIPYVKLGKIVRYEPSVVEAFIQKGGAK